MLTKYNFERGDMRYFDRKVEEVFEIWNDKSKSDAEKKCNLKRILQSVAKDTDAGAKVFYGRSMKG